VIPERYAPTTYALMRIVFGFLWFFHGIAKFGAFGGQIPAFGTLVFTAGVLETVLGVLIMIGLFTRPAAFLASGQMAVAYWLRHNPQGLWPINNGGELAALYCFGFLYIATRGAGILSVDGSRRR